MSKIHSLLSEWGRWSLEHLDHANEYGTNTLYAAGLLGGRVQDKGDGHKVLDVDTPYHLRRIDHALHRINPHAALAVKVYYCCPLRDDGQKYSNQELASLMHLSEASFSSLVKQGRRELWLVGVV